MPPDLIKESFIARRDLPPALVEKLLSLTSAKLAAKLVETHALPIDLAVSLATSTRERATLDFLDQSWLQNDMDMLVRRLSKADRLTNSIIIRAAGRGHLRFLEASLAERAGIRRHKAAVMLHDDGPFALSALCRQAGLPENEQVFIRACVAIYRDLELSGQAKEPTLFQNLMLERVLSLGMPINAKDNQYLQEKLDLL